MNIKEREETLRQNIPDNIRNYDGCITCGLPHNETIESDSNIMKLIRKAYDLGYANGKKQQSFK